MVKYLCGDLSKAERKLSWKPKYDINMLIEEIFENDYNEAIKEKQSREGRTVCIINIKCRK